jgi:mannose-6-phosphate isomerase-like protein (cupin superfamily)
MTTIRHEPPEALSKIPLEDLLKKRVARFDRIPPDWDAFADSRVEGRRRAQHRFVGAGGSGKHDDPNVVPAEAFTLSVMKVPPGQGGSAHTHEVEEVFFVLEGRLTVFFEDRAGRQVAAELGKWEMVSCPPGILHGFENRSEADVYMQTMIGSPRPGPVGYADDEIYREESRRLAERASVGAK